MRRVAIVALLLGVACDAAETGTEVRSGVVNTAAPQRGAVVGGERLQRSVRWPAADAIDREVAARLAQRDRDALARAPVPMLLPPDAAIVTAGRVMVGPTWAAFASRAGANAVSLSASGEARLYPHLRPKAPRDQVRGRPAYVGFSEGIWSARWIERGVAYSLELECAVAGDPECGEAAIRVLAESLVVVGPEALR